MNIQLSRNFLLCLVALATSLVTTQVAVAQNVSASPEHAVLKHELGVWDSVMTMDSPDGKLVIKGVETNKMLSDMWLSSTLKYDAFGQKMVGHGVFGYDPNKKKYTGTWHDSASPYQTVMEGTWDEDKKTFLYDMKTRDAASGEEMIGKITIQYEDDDNKTFVMQVENPEKKGELMDYFTMKYTKRK